MKYQSKHALHLLDLECFKPVTLFDLPSDLRGPANNKYGGHRGFRLKTFGGQFGAANVGRRYSPEEIAKWESENARLLQPTKKPPLSR